jgi:HEAT repeat protein
MRTPMGLMTRERQDLLVQLDALDPHSNPGVLRLKQHLRDPRAWVRLPVLKLLSLSRHPEAAAAVLSAAFDPHPRIFKEVRMWLQEQGEVTLKGYWTKLSRDPQSPVSRLWNYFLPSEAGEKLRPLFSSKDPRLVLRVLSHCPSESGLSAWKSQEFKHPLVALAFDWCLGKPRTTLLEREINTLWQHAKELPISRYWMRLLCEVLDPRAKQQLTALMAADEDAYAGLLDARAFCGDQKAVAVFEQQIEDQYADQRIVALNTLVLLAEKKILSQSDALIPALVRRLSDSDQWARLGAARLSGIIGDTRLSLPLIARMKDDWNKVRAAAAYSLGRLKSVDAVPALVEIGVDDSNKEVRDMSYGALHHIAHGLPLPPAALVSEWLSVGSPNAESFWGRDRARWRRWYQLER